MSIVVWPHNMGSAGSKELAQALKVKRVYPDRNFRPKPGDIVINWGNSKLPIWDLGVCKVINDPAAISTTINKLECLRMISSRGVTTVEFTTDMEEAQNWADDGYPVYSRTILNGTGGEGIFVSAELDEVKPAPMYTKGCVKHHTEFRVHVLGEDAFWVAQKMRVGKARREANNIDLNRYVRNHDNGWIFSTENAKGNCAGTTLRESIKAVKACGLHFGAVDILQDERTGAARVLEINTAPGLVGITATQYGERFNKMLNGS